MLTARHPCCAASGYSRLWSARPRLRHHLMSQILTKPRLGLPLRCVSNCSCTARTLCALHAICVWTRWDSGWKTTTLWRLRTKDGQFRSTRPAHAGRKRILTAHRIKIFLKPAQAFTECLTRDDYYALGQARSDESAIKKIVRWARHLPLRVWFWGC